MAGYDIVVSQGGVQENQLLRPQRVRTDLTLLTRHQIRAVAFIVGYEFFGFLLGAAVVGVNIEKPSASIFLPGDEILRVAVERIEQPHFADFFREPSMIQNGSDDVITAAVAG